MTRIIFLYYTLLAVFQNDINGQITAVKNDKLNNGIYFACPPCGIDCDTVHFQKPGICPVCGMKLFAAYHGNENTTGNHHDIALKNVAVLLYNGVEIIDFAGPWEVFGAAGMNVYAVAAEDSTVETSMGLKIKPDYTYLNAPTPDIILVPGGNVNPDDTLALNWLIQMNASSEHTMSVCTGAFYLAAGGLLNGITATTNYPAIEQLRQMAPETKVVDNVRYVNNGKIITSAGLSSGIDAAFHLVSLYIGNAETKRLANALEYNWNDSAYFVRSKLADKYVQDFLDMLIPYNYKMNKYFGNENEWVTEIDLLSNVPAEELLTLIEVQFSQVSGWTKSAGENSWSFIDKGENWHAVLSISANGNSNGTLELKITRNP